MVAPAISAALTGEAQLPKGAVVGWSGGVVMAIFLGAVRAFSRCMNRYRPSTLSRAHGVLRKNFRLDGMLGSRLKLRIWMRSPRSSQPK